MKLDQKISFNSLNKFSFKFLYNYNLHFCMMIIKKKKPQ